jgi:hypothetical protein
MLLTRLAEFRLFEGAPARRPGLRTQLLPAPTFTRLKRLLRMKLLLMITLFRPQPGFHPHPRQPPLQTAPTAIPTPNEMALAATTPVYGG